MIRLVLVDDEILMRSGLRLILEGADDLEVVGEASDGEEVEPLVADLDPDLVLMDIRMPGVDGIEATRRLVAGGHRARVLMLTTYDLDEHLYAAIRVGAAGYLLKTAPTPQLLATIRAASAGETVLAPSITRRLLDRFASAPPPGAHNPALDRLQVLTAREREVLQQMAAGLSNAQIAAGLFVSEATVKSHVNSVFRKLAVRDRVQAVILAYESGLVQPGP